MTGQHMWHSSKQLFFSSPSSHEALEDFPSGPSPFTKLSRRRIVVAPVKLHP